MVQLTDEEVFWYDEGKLSREIEEKLGQLREQLQSEGVLVEGLDDRNALLRFLKARQWCLHKAAKMYKVTCNGTYSWLQSSACRPAAPMAFRAAAHCKSRPRPLLSCLPLSASW